MNTFVGTLAWMAPEIKQEYTISQAGDQPSINKIDLAKADIFSLGLISLYCLDSQNFWIINERKILNENAELLSNYYREFNKIKEEKKPKIPKGFYYLIRCMLSYDFHTRPTIEELKREINRFLKSKQVDLNTQKPIIYY